MQFVSARSAFLEKKKYNNYKKKKKAPGPKLKPLKLKFDFVDTDSKRRRTGKYGNFLSIEGVFFKR